jgi:hypothetical protein
MSSSLQRLAKKAPAGWDEVYPQLEMFENRMKDAVNESHEGKRKNETTWPIHRIHWEKSRFGPAHSPSQYIPLPFPRRMQNPISLPSPFQVEKHWVRPCPSPLTPRRSAARKAPPPVIGCTPRDAPRRSYAGNAQHASARSCNM